MESSVLINPWMIADVLSGYDIFGGFYATRGKPVEFDESRKVIVAQILKHELCIILLDVEGFYDKDIDSMKYAAKIELFLPNKSDDEIVEDEFKGKELPTSDNDSWVYNVQCKYNSS
ncbi:hypothetical protein Tco_1322462 [Tanacetum coccineum]